MSGKRGPLPVFLAASLALHAWAIAGLPVLLRDYDPPAARVLDVVLVQPEPLPVAQPEPAVPPRREPRKKEARPAPAASNPKVTRRLPQKAEIPVAPAPQVLVQPEPASRDTARTAPASPTETATVRPQPEATASRAAQETASPPAPPVFNAAYLRNPPPRYPLAARRKGEQGTVTLKVLVNADGVPANVSVEKTSGSVHLDNAALDTVRSWRFVPARQGAQPIEAWVLVPIVFRLEGAS